MTRQNAQVLAVNFHFVGDATAARFPGIHNRSEHEFLHQLDQLEAEGGFITPNQLEQMVESGDYSPGYVLTFDDGLVDHAGFVADELDRRGIQSFFFLNTAGWKGEILDVHKLQLLNASCEFDQLWSRFLELLREKQLPYEPSNLSTDEIRSVYTYDDLPMHGRTATLGDGLGNLATPLEVGYG